MPISIGCAVWSYPGWAGEVYPPKTSSKEFLRLYGNHFPAVEGNTTFYATPDRSTIERWIAQTPTGFKFCLKFPRAITHNGLLEPYLLPAQAFISQVQALRDRLGVMFIQLPPNYAPDDRAFSDLSAFLTALPRRDISLAVEVRHLNWFESPHQERLTELLWRLGVGRVILDSRPIYEANLNEKIAFTCKKPHVPIELSLTAPFTLIRYVSHPVQSVNQKWLAGWAIQVREWLQQDTQVYMFVHCPIEARSPVNARYLHQIFTQSGIELAALPPQLTVDSPVQLNLFS